jgi:hypothetical protein
MSVTKDTEIQAEHRVQMNAIAQMLDEVFNGDKKHPNKEVCFVLLLCKFGDVRGDRCNYISNGADRKDIATLFREMAARFEGQPEMEGRA